MKESNYAAEVELIKALFGIEGAYRETGKVLASHEFREVFLLELEKNFVDTRDALDRMIVFLQQERERTETEQETVKGATSETA